LRNEKTNKLLSNVVKAMKGLQAAAAASSHLVELTSPPRSFPEKAMRVFLPPFNLFLLL
jgi:hypothetical protein